MASAFIFPPRSLLLAGAVFFAGPLVAQTDTTPPSVPINLAAATISPTQVNLTWPATTVRR